MKKKQKSINFIISSYKIDFQFPFNLLLIYFVKTGNCIINKITQYVDYLIT